MKWLKFLQEFFNFGKPIAEEIIKNHKQSKECEKIKEITMGEREQLNTAIANSSISAAAQSRQERKNRR